MEIITRAEAKERGLKRYFTGVACRNRHVSERTIKGNRCVECESNRNKRRMEYIGSYRVDNKKEIQTNKKEYYSKNKEKILSKQQEWNQSNKDRIAERDKRYYDENLQLIKEKKKQYYIENSESIKIKRRIYNITNKNQISNYNKTPERKTKVSNRNHERRVKVGKGDVTTQQLLILQKKQTHCYWCNTPLKNKVAHVDHYIPLSKGGQHTISNLVMACAKCNLSKGAKMPEEFAMQVGRLL